MVEKSREVDLLRDMINMSERIVVFTGAGISTESGIPDFRSPGGIWSKMKPIDFGDFMASEEMRRESWRRKMGSDGKFSAAKPNRGHRAVAELVARGKCSAIITQNVDGLHTASGVPEDQVIELHGNATYAKCLGGNCGKRFELGPILEAFKADETLPICDECGGIIKTATISFGQAMPAEPMQRAEEATLECDLFIVMGSSLVVYPAAGFPLMAKQKSRHGLPEAKLVIINREPTELDPTADLALHAELGDTLGIAVGIE